LVGSGARQKTQGKTKLKILSEIKLPLLYVELDYDCFIFGSSPNKDDGKRLVRFGACQKTQGKTALHTALPTTTALSFLQVDGGHHKHYDKKKGFLFQNHSEII
jgi:hypothetical protein